MVVNLMILFILHDCIIKNTRHFHCFWLLSQSQWTVDGQHSRSVDGQHFRTFDCPHIKTFDGQHFRTVDRVRLAKLY